MRGLFLTSLWAFGDACVRVGYSSTQFFYTYLLELKVITKLPL